VHGELADVVEERRPAEPVPICKGEPHFVGDHVREGPDTLGVPTGLSIVAAKGGGKREDLFSHGGRHLLVGTRPFARPAFEFAGRTRPPRDLHPLRGLVGEKHGHLQQGGKRKKAPAETLRPDKRDRRRAEHGNPPKRLSEQSFSAGDLVPHGHCGRDRYREGSRNRGNRQEGAQHTVRAPTLRLDHLAFRGQQGRKSVISDLTVAR
jgi:hypothetical protein